MTRVVAPRRAGQMPVLPAMLAALLALLLPLTPAGFRPGPVDPLALPDRTGVVLTGPVGTTHPAVFGLRPDARGLAHRGTGTATAPGGTTGTGAARPAGAGACWAAAPGDTARHAGIGRGDAHRGRAPPAGV